MEPSNCRPVGRWMKGVAAWSLQCVLLQCYEGIVARFYQKISCLCWWKSLHMMRIIQTYIAKSLQCVWAVAFGVSRKFCLFITLAIFAGRSLGAWQLNGCTKQLAGGGYLLLNTQSWLGYLLENLIHDGHFSPSGSFRLLKMYCESAPSFPHNLHHSQMEWTSTNFSHQICTAVKYTDLNSSVIVAM